MGELWRAVRIRGTHGGAHADSTPKKRYGRRWGAWVGGGGKAGWEAVGGALMGSTPEGRIVMPAGQFRSYEQVNGAF